MRLRASNFEHVMSAGALRFAAFLFLRSNTDLVAMTSCRADRLRSLLTVPVAAVAESICRDNRNKSVKRRRRGPRTLTACRHQCRSFRHVRAQPNPGPSSCFKGRLSRSPDVYYFIPDYCEMPLHSGIGQKRSATTRWWHTAKDSRHSVTGTWA